MIRKSDLNERRILTFQAVHPCESISPTTLLSSLINLSNNIINYNSKFFPCHKKINREVIRQIQILHIFFHEIIDNDSKITHSLNLCLSELHFILQKIQFLLEDCIQNGAKLYILMKSKFVVDHLRSMMRSVGVVLDIVDLTSLEISNEVKELVLLLAKQARKALLELDSNDELVMDWVSLILTQFKNGFEPEKCLIKKVLDCLKIKSWNDCNDEVNFLEEEMSGGKYEEKEIPLLCDLLGFVWYCRGVIFESIENDDEIMSQEENKLSGMKLKLLNFEDFRCPISLGMMMDPVIVSTGQTYDRCSIEKWIKTGNLLCPKTGERLKSPELIPNLAVRRIIHQFCLDSGVSILNSRSRSRDSLIKMNSFSFSCKEAMGILAQFLGGRLRYGTNEQKNKAAYEIKLLTKSGIFVGSVLVEVGIVSLLLDLLSSSDPDTQENVIVSLLKLSKLSKGQKIIIKEGGLMPLILVLRQGLKMESRQMAAAIIFHLSTVDKYRKMVGSTSIVFPALIELIKDGTMHGKKNALAAIFALLMNQTNHERAIEANIVQVLVDIIASSSEKSVLTTDSLAILASLVESIYGTIAVSQTSALPLIIRIVKSSTDQTVTEYCVSILLSLCINGGAEVVAILARELVLMASLYSVIVHGRSQASKKARVLISLLQKFDESSSSNLAVAALHKERILQAL